MTTRRTRKHIKNTTLKKQPLLSSLNVISLHKEKNVKGKKDEVGSSHANYTKKHYNSNDGMLTMIWGPPIWHFLHCISFNYPVEPSEEDKRHYMDFIYNLKHILPCGKCRKNLKNNFKKLPLKMEHLENRETFSKYVYDLHETVNTMLVKKSGLTYDMVRDRYEHFRARCLNGKEINGGNRKTRKENGCVKSLYGKKSKCLLRIVPDTMNAPTFTQLI
jgi:hypothetical protein